jgi:hypothetical protein
LMANVINNINGFARLEDTNGGVWELDSPSFSVTTSNEITFENWMPAFGELGNTLLIRATSAHIDTDWNIDIYNSSNSYVGSLSGHTYDGDIYATWDLFDVNGIQHTNDNFFTFKISTQYIDPKTPKTYKANDPWTGSGAWAFGVQHAFDGFMDNELLYDELDGFYHAAKSAYFVGPVGPGSNEHPYPIGFENTTETNDWLAFKDALFFSGTRNVVYFGHGGPNGLGYDQSNTNLSLTVKEIGNFLHTIPAGQTNIHRFRFVFLDGCSTGGGTMPEAFGIRHQENVSSMDYYNDSLRPSAFVGWSAEKYIAYIANHTINYDHVNFIQFIQDNMLLYGKTIADAKSNAARQIPPGVIFTSQLKIFGCPDETFGGYNN